MVEWTASKFATLRSRLRQLPIVCRFAFVPPD
jgi:hypothetical protein